MARTNALLTNSALCSLSSVQVMINGTQTSIETGLRHGDSEDPNNLLMVADGVVGDCSVDSPEDVEAAVRDLFGRCGCTPEDDAAGFRAVVALTEAVWRAANAL